VISLLKGLIKDMERLEERLRQDTELFDRICMKLYALEKAIADQAGAGVVRRPPPVAKMPPGPAPTVQNFRLEELGDGRVAVTFDGTEKVILSETLKELLTLLAADHENSPDDLVAWKSYGRLGEQLAERLGHKFDRHAVAQLVWRLREKLGAIDRRLIERVPVLGARLRLKRRPLSALYAG
jgi:hypothetical protein